MIFKKRENFRLCTGIMSYEFECKCKYEHCRSSYISPKLMVAFKKLRLKIGRPVQINSGHRCSEHNFDVGGVAMSQHLRGYALDLSTTHFNQDIIVTLAKECGFTFIKKYKTFIHLDVR